MCIRDRLIEMGPENRARLGEAARKRIAENFSLPVIAARYEQLYKEVCHMDF